jgi:hypothetical protein
MQYLYLISVALLVLLSGNTLAAADGPDYFQVIGIDPSDNLNIHTEPRPDATRPGVIPQGSDCIRNLG